MVLEPFLGKSRFNSHGQRVVEGQRADAGGERHHARLDPCERVRRSTRDFYVRQLWDPKGSALVDVMDPTAMTVYASLGGRALAKAHARPGDAVAIAGAVGSGEGFDRALASFAETYADQNERDYRALHEAIASGRVVAETAF